MKRFRLRFSLRSLLLLVLLIGAGATLWHHWKPWGLRNEIAEPCSNEERGSVEFSPDGRHLLTTANGRTRIRSLSAPAAAMTLEADSDDETTYCSHYSADGRRVVTTESTRIRIWNAETGKLEVLLPDSNESSLNNDVAYFSADDGWVFTWPKVRFWNAKTGALNVVVNPGLLTRTKGFASWDEERREAFKEKCRQLAASETLPDFAAAASHDYVTAAVSRNGRWVLTCVDDDETHAAIVWDFSSGKRVARLEGGIYDATHTDNHQGYFSPDGQMVLAPADRGLTLWNATTGKTIGHIPDCSAGVELPVFAPDGQRFQVFIESGAELCNVQPFERVSDNFSDGCMVFPDNSRLLECAEDDALVVWDKTGQLELDELEIGAPRRLSPGTTLWSNLHCSISPDCRRIAALKNDRISIFEQRRPEYAYGVVCLPELWLTALLLIAMIWSVHRDRKAR